MNQPINASMVPEVDSLGASMQESMRKRILHNLEVFPFLSSSMLHIGIGTATMTEFWKPVLAKLVEDGEVCVHEVTAMAPSDRRQVYTIYHLPGMIYGGKGLTTAPNTDNTAAAAA